MLSDGKYKKYLTPVYLFSYFILLAFVVHAILLIENPEGAQRYMYFEGFKNLFADYFSCIRHSSDKNPYFSDYFFQSNYLPFVHILYYPFSQLDNFAEMTLENFVVRINHAEARQNKENGDSDFPWKCGIAVAYKDYYKCYCSNNL